MTASFLRCRFLKLFPRFSDLYVLVCSCPCFSLLPAEAALIVLHGSAVLRAVGLALPPRCRRLAWALGCEETQQVSEHRGFAFKKHGITQGEADLESIICAFSISHRPLQDTSGQWESWLPDRCRDTDVNRAQTIASADESSQS